jgi:hypothetical protein
MRLRPTLLDFLTIFLFATAAGMVVSYYAGGR